jgi:hypothetical protein
LSYSLSSFVRSPSYSHGGTPSRSGHRGSTPSGRRAVDTYTSSSWGRPPRLRRRMVGSDTRLYPAVDSPRAEGNEAARGHHQLRARPPDSEQRRRNRGGGRLGPACGNGAERGVPAVGGQARRGRVPGQSWFSSTVAKDAEPAALARTAYHVLVAWIAVTAAHVGASARSLTGSSLIRSLSTSLRRAFSSSPHRPRP